MTERVDERRRDVEVGRGQRGGDVVEEPEAVRGPNLDDRGELGGRVVDRHGDLRGPGRRRPARARVGAVLGLQALVELEGAVQGARHVRLDGRPVRLAVEGRFHVEDLERHVARPRTRRRPQHVAAVEREHAGHGGEQAGPVRRDDRDAAPEGAQREAALLHRADQLRWHRRRGWGGERATVEHVADARGEGRDELRLPRSPCGRPRGDAVGFGQRGEERERPAVLHQASDDVRRRGVVQIAAGGHLGEDEVVGDEAQEDRDVLLGEAHAPNDALRDVPAHLAVVARRALAEVVEQRRHDEQIRAVDRAQVRAAPGDRLQQVPVDRVAVVGVALRPVADHRPLGEEQFEQTPAVERLDDGDEGVTGLEEIEEGVAQPRGPRLRRGAGVGREAIERLPLDQDVALRGGAGDPDDERRIAGGVGVVGEGDLPVAHDDAGLDGRRRRGVERGRPA